MPPIELPPVPPLMHRYPPIVEGRAIPGMQQSNGTWWGFPTFALRAGASFAHVLPICQGYADLLGCVTSLFFCSSACHESHWSRHANTYVCAKPHVLQSNLGKDEEHEKLGCAVLSFLQLSISPLQHVRCLTPHCVHY
jgi:hypothetical protein